LQNKTAKTVIFSGTLGDAFIVLCKLYGRHKNTGEYFQVMRFSRHPQMDLVIKSLFDIVPFAEYLPPCREVENEKDLKHRIAKSPHDYLSTVWNGQKQSWLKQDPHGYPMEPYPEIEIAGLPLQDSDATKFRVGIQLHTGKVNSNFKGFSLKWISSLLKWLSPDQFKVYMFGTGDRYSAKEIARFCEKHGIENLVGKTSFTEWLGYIKAMDFFISPEGFSAFFAMSQKVRSLVFYTDYQILGRVAAQ